MKISKFPISTHHICQLCFYILTIKIPFYLDLVWVLCRSPWLLCIQGCNGHVVLRRQHVTAPALSSGSYIHPAPSPAMFLELAWGAANKVCALRP